MGTREIRVHHNDKCEALTNVDVWGYQFVALTEDIMKKFLPTGSVASKLKITCDCRGNLIPVVDNRSLRKCLFFGEAEINMYVEIEYHIREPEVVGLQNIIDDAVLYESEVVGLENFIDDTLVNKFEVDKENREDQEFNEGESMNKEVDEENVCGLSTDEDYKSENDGCADSYTSLDDEEFENTCSDDGLSGDESDDERVDTFATDSEHEEEFEILTREAAGTWFKKKLDGSIELRAGLLFSNVYHFRDVLRDYVIQEGFELIRHKNEKSRVTVSCAGDGCSWRLHASPTPDGVTYKIKTYNGEHVCVRKSRFRDATSTWIAHNLIHKFSADPKKARKGIQQDLVDEFGITGISDMKIFRARQKAQVIINGDAKEQYGKLRSYGELVLLHNPGSIFKLMPWERQTIDCPLIFKRQFIMFEGVRRGFLDGCRPFFGLDGCFLKGCYGGVLLSAVTLDGNNGVLPITVCVAEFECRDSWEWFLGILKDGIGVDFGGLPWTIISDRQKGLIDGIGKIFPNAIQRYCLFHIAANFKLKFRGAELKKLLGSAGCAYNVRDFNASMERMKEINIEAHSWLKKIPEHLWCRHALNPVSKVDHVSNQASESFNAWIAGCRDLPILTLLEEYRLKIMKRLHSRYERATKFAGKLVPKVVKRINEEWKQARKFEVVNAGYGEFQCKMGSQLRVVNLTKWECDCGKWRITGIPCMLAMACIRTSNEEIEDYCHMSYSIGSYFNIYKNMVHPQPDLGILPIPTGEIMQPPPLRRPPGRPKKARRPHEAEKVKTKRSTIAHCSICKVAGHNKRGCKKGVVGSNKVAASTLACSQPSSSTQIPPSTQDSSTKLRPKLGVRSLTKRQRT